MTLLAPTNDAFDMLPAETVAFLTDPVNVDALVEVLTYHVLPDVYPSTLLTDGMMIDTLEGTPVTVSATMGSVMFNGATVGLPDLLANNGIVHVIDTVLTIPVAATDSPTMSPTSAPTSPPTNAPTPTISCTGTLLSPTTDWIRAPPGQGNCDAACSTCGSGGTCNPSLQNTVETEADFNAVTAVIPGAPSCSNFGATDNADFFPLSTAGGEVCILDRLAAGSCQSSTPFITADAVRYCCCGSNCPVSPP